MLEEIFQPSVERSSIRIRRGTPAPVDAEYQWHFHRAYEMFYAEQGSRVFYTDREEVRLQEGEILFLGRRIPHRTFTPKGTGGILLQFDYEAPAEASTLFLPEPLGVERMIFAAGTPENRELRQCFEKILAEQEGGRSGAALYIRAYTLQIIACLHRVGAMAEREAEPARLATVLPALEYANAHYSENISLSAVCSLLNIDKSHFCRIFKKAVGVSFLQYLNQLRIHRAEQLLAESEKSISAIADEVGFLSASYFAETFRKVHSASPRAWRRMLTDHRV